MIRAYVDRDPLTFSDRVAIVERREDADGSSSHILRLSSDGPPTWERIEGNVTVAPTFLIDREAARALLDALAAHFEGSADTRVLRRDYDAERGRVDKLIDAMARTTATLATGAAAHA